MRCVLPWQPRANCIFSTLPNTTRVQHWHFRTCDACWCNGDCQKKPTHPGSFRPISDLKSIARQSNGKIQHKVSFSFLHQRSSDLIVLGTHGREGVERWLKGSVSEAVFRRFAVPTLFLTQGARGFVSQVNGDIRLRRVLIPIDFSPAPSNAIDTIERFCALLTGSNVAVHLIHIGRSAPPLHPQSINLPDLPEVILRSGNVVKSIVDAAIEFDVDLIGMPTAGHHGVLDALRGSTTERVIRHAPCPVFAVPVVSSMPA